MAKPSLIFQRLQHQRDHEQALLNLLRSNPADGYIISVAYARSTGIAAVASDLAQVSGKTEIFVGIRNGITSAQALLSFLRVGVTPIAVDVATTKVIFHPKVYVAYDEDSARVIIGSANLTAGGLRSNVEASIDLELDLSSTGDEGFMADLKGTFKDLKQSYPDNVFPVTNARQVVQLLHQGRLEDERMAQLPSGANLKTGAKVDTLSPMMGIASSSKAKATKQPKRSIIQARPSSHRGTLVWESAALTKRSLNIPSGSSTNITGDTNLTQGSMAGLDFQTYFRQQVFQNLSWQITSGSAHAHLERTRIDVEIVIKGVSYGAYELEVTHDPRTNTSSYNQKNAMTKIKWGAARQIIARRDLLGCTLKLYKKSSNQFAISID